MKRFILVLAALAVLVAPVRADPTLSVGGKNYVAFCLQPQLDVLGPLLCLFGPDDDDPGFGDYVMFPIRGGGGGLDIVTSGGDWYLDDSFPALPLIHAGWFVLAGPDGLESSLRFDMTCLFLACVTTTPPGLETALLGFLTVDFVDGDTRDGDDSFFIENKLVLLIELPPSS